MDLARAPRRAPLTARKKGSGYENVVNTDHFCFRKQPEDVLLAGTNYNRPFWKVLSLGYRASFS